MTGLATAAWVAVSSVGSFSCTWSVLAKRGESALARLSDQARAEIRHWQDQTMRARAVARRAERDAEVAAAARQQTREEIRLLLPLLSDCQRCGYRPRSGNGPAQEPRR